MRTLRKPKKKKKLPKKKIIMHLKGDIKNYQKEADEDRELIKSLNKKKK